MTKKDFKLIAETIRELDLPDKHRTEIIKSFVRSLRSTNPRFDGARFAAAAYPRNFENGLVRMYAKE